MKKYYELLVFDWDGTLMDSVGTIVRCLRQAFRKSGLTPLPDERYRGIIGLGLQEALAALRPDLPAAAWEAVTAHYRDCFLSVSQAEMPFFPGAEETLRALHRRGYRLAVATGKARRGLDRLFSQYEVASVFSSSRCADECASKPAPDMLLEIMTETGCAPAQTLMVGDAVYDMLMARAAGVDALGVSHGVGERVVLREQGALDCLDSLHELLPWLERHGRGDEVAI